MTIDSFQFVHYGTVIKNDFCQLSLLQHVQSSFCNGAMPNIVFFVCFFCVSSVELRKREKKHGSPVSPGVSLYSYLFIIGEMMV